MREWQLDSLFVGRNVRAPLRLSFAICPDSPEAACERLLLFLQGFLAISLWAHRPSSRWIVGGNAD